MASARDTLEVYRDKRREYRWRLRNRNGKITAASTEGYKRRGSCIKNIRRTGSLLEMLPVQG